MFRYPRALLLVALAGTPARSATVRFYFSAEGDAIIGAVPGEFLTQTIPAIQLGQPAYLWAHVNPPDRWVGVDLVFSQPLYASYHYNPDISGGLTRWDGMYTDLFRMDCWADLACGLGHPFDTWGAPGGHYLVAMVIFLPPPDPGPTPVYLSVGPGGIVPAAGGAELVYFGFGDEAVDAGLPGAQSTLPDMWSLDIGACCLGWTCIDTGQADCFNQGGAYLGLSTQCVPGSCDLVTCHGDTNCDGSVTFKDIDRFVARLGCPGGASCTSGTCWWWNADMNGDGQVTFADIDPFVARLGASCP